MWPKGTQWKSWCSVLRINPSLKEGLYLLIKSLCFQQSQMFCCCINQLSFVNKIINHIDLSIMISVNSLVLHSSKHSINHMTGCHIITNHYPISNHHWVSVSNQYDLSIPIEISTAARSDRTLKGYGLNNKPTMTGNGLNPTMGLWEYTIFSMMDSYHGNIPF